jgi:DNA (cytosine-5)-methyltransferase 1
MIPGKLIVDLFAGGGGMSVAFERAFGRSPDIAINHNDDALSMHRANHPHTRHFVADVFEVDPRAATQMCPVGWLHLSPDCRHHSQAAGGQPRSRKIRALAWVACRWAGQVRPDVISLENVKQILKWSPLVAKRDRATGRVIKRDGSVAAAGERTPLEQQYLIPNPKREGKTWRAFVAALECLGYTVEWRTLVAADYGAHTTRERLFLLARRDGQPIRWPMPTHFKQPHVGETRWKAAEECINFSDLGKSIFGRPRPLAAATLRRIARGVPRSVLDTPEPFIVKTVSTGPRNLLASPVLVGVGGRAGQSDPTPADNPMRTITAKADTALSVAYMMQANGGYNTVAGHDLAEPMSAITATGSQQQLVTCQLSRTDASDALRVAAFLLEYYSCGSGSGNLSDPIDTITTHDRFALVTVFVRGVPHVVVDIRLRMLTPRELFRGQDFPESYIIDRGHDGRVFSHSAQVRMCGNSVDSVVAAAFLTVNAPWLAMREAA